ncbi:MAG: hypothetical protein Unbinned664contig1000_39 [Prokaryotic dsDNA virus sp.]|nr:MAG: hypothetical protein Unbinned664contig1000_39 [Prokaryotic dsDNA virus sp.]|tara:strand:- start:8035 stop:8742 length:708 start_codon:yes stop_codon:yes gene_type:complete
MPLKSARQIAEEALRTIGVYSINDSEAQQNHIEVALNWFGMILDQAGALGLPFLREETVLIDLVEDQTAYPLADETAAGVIFPLQTWLVHKTLGTVRQINLLTREDWDREVSSENQEAGEPCNVFVDQIGLRTLHIDHAPTADVAANYQIKARVNGYASNDPTDQKGALVQVPPMWNIWAIYQLATHLGSGPIKRLAPNIISDHRGTAAMYFEQMQSAMQRNRTNRAPVANPHWM